MMDVLHCQLQHQQRTSFSVVGGARKSYHSKSDKNRGVQSTIRLRESLCHPVTVWPPTRYDLGSVYLHEAPGGEGLPEEAAHPGLQSVDGLVGGCPQVQDAVVQTGVLVHPDVQPFWILRWCTSLLNPST